ncbi:hypothetical protein I4U23_030988 [Adineta vaga]|nr:hypothetical protein I4U23_030988 [Adineta vaga]
MSRRRSSKYFDLYCCLSNEFLIAYPQPQILSYDDQRKKRKPSQNTNAFNSTKSKHFYMKKDLSNMADGDKQSTNVLHDKCYQQRFTDELEHDNVIRPTPCRLQCSDANILENSTIKISCSRSTLISNRSSTWRKLQTNIPASHYNHIQHERQQQQPVMLSPLKRQTEIEPSETSNTMNTFVSSIESQCSLSDLNEPRTYSIENVVIDHKSNISFKNKDPPSIVVPNQISSTESSIQKNDNIEEFKPVSEISSLFLNDILLSSFFSTTNSNPLVYQSNHHANSDIKKTSFMIFDDTPDITELLMIDQPLNEHHPSKKVTSLITSIEELCLLIRKLLQSQLTEQKTTSLQAMLSTQLAILLTYLAMPKNEKQTVDKITSTDLSSQTSPIETQTDLEWNIQSNNQKSDPVPKLSSHTELISTSITLHLPTRRLDHALSETFIHHLQRCSTSHHRITSFSETLIHHLHQSSSTKEKTKHLLKYIDRKFQHYIELESSNTFLEASTEFTPDFLLTTMNNSKYDDDEDQTEQFGIDLEKQEKFKILAVDSLRMNQSINEFKIEEEENTSKSSMTEINSLFLNNTTSISFEDEFNSSKINQLNEKDHCYQLLKPFIHSHQWQTPILLTKSTSIDSIYEKQTANIRSNRNHRVNIIGKRVMIKSKSSSRSSTPTNRSHSSKYIFFRDLFNVFTQLDQEQLRRASFLNYNNNYHDTINSTQSLQSLSTIADKFDSNIALAQDLLVMLDSFNYNNDHSSTTNISLLHTYIRQFLIQFDTRIYLERKRRKRHTKIIYSYR